MFQRISSFIFSRVRVRFAFVFLGLACSLLYAGPIKVNAPNSTYFVANEGQWEGDFQFKCEVGSTVYYVTPKGMTVDFREFTQIPPQSSGGARGGKIPSGFDPFERKRDSVTVRGHVVQIHYVIPPQSSGGARGGQAVGEEKLSHYSNYFFGRDSTNWRSRVGHYQKIVVPEVWPGIDVEYRADQLGVETVYHVKPGADPSQIQMEYLGLDAPLRVDAQGNLVLTTSLGDVKEKAPFAFQQNGRVQVNVVARFWVIADDQAFFQIDSYNVSKELVIDPLITSTLFSCGGLFEYCNGIAEDHDGNLLIAGNTTNTEFPATPGAYQETLLTEVDGYVLKMNPDADELLFATLFPQGARKIVETLAGNILIVAGAGDQWPITPDAFDSTLGSYTDLGIATLSSDGTTLLFGSMFGGDSVESVRDLALDSLGRAYVLFQTNSPNIQTTPDALYPNFTPYECPALMVFDPDEPEVEYSSYFTLSDTGARGAGGISFDNEGGVWLSLYTYMGDYPVTAGAFVDELVDERSAYFCRLNIQEGELTYGSYFGRQSTPNDGITDIIPLSSDSFLLAGDTFNPEFELPPGGYDTLPPANESTGKIFLLKGTTQAQILSGSFLGGTVSTFSQTAYSHPAEIALDEQGCIVLRGSTNATDFPTTQDAVDSIIGPEFDEFSIDMVICKLSPDLDSLFYSTYYGGWGYDDGRDFLLTEDSRCWVVGTTDSWDFPTTPNALYSDFFGFEQGFIVGIEINPTAISPEHRLMPDRFNLQVFPNPFNSSANVLLDLNRSAHVSLDLFDILGRRVVSHEYGFMSAGTHNLPLLLNRQPTGSYFLKITADQQHELKQIKLIR